LDAKLSAVGIPVITSLAKLGPDNINIFVMFRDFVAISDISFPLSLKPFEQIMKFFIF
jgi:glutaredoxin 2